jgi:hypothetical protein
VAFAIFAVAQHQSSGIGKNKLSCAIYIHIKSLSQVFLLFGSRIFSRIFSGGRIKIKIKCFFHNKLIPELTSGFFDVGGKNKIKYFF